MHIIVTTVSTMFSIVQRHSFSPLLLIIWSSVLLRIFFLGNHDLLTEEAYYWNYAQHMDFGYLDHPPLVAVLIRLSTTCFGLNEFAVRFPALLCWGVTAYFIYRWAELIQTQSGRYALLLLSILPFFFLNSCIITPDMPLLATWAAALYYLYRALCLKEPRAWYAAGISIGLGLLAKYSIALLIMTTGVMLCTNRDYRHWLLRKEPYYAAVLILLCFSPVIYWNATHEWISFAFQSTRRLQDHPKFSLHFLIGIGALFLTPVGIMGCIKLCRWTQTDSLTAKTIGFIRAFLGLPLLVFAIFSCFRAIKLDWIGPCFLAVLPWLAYNMQEHNILRQWLKTTPVLLGTYCLILICLTYGQPRFLNQHAFSHLLSVSWQNLTHDLLHIAADYQTQYATQPILLPLDTYRVESELVFYQSKQRQLHPDTPVFPVHNAARFGISGLMFELWDHHDLQDKIVLLISREKSALQTSVIQNTTKPLAEVQILWGKSPHCNARITPYYYQLVRMI